MHCLWVVTEKKIKLSNIGNQGYIIYNLLHLARVCNSHMV